MKTFNKRAQFDYELFERFEAGVMLTGAEAKAFRDGRASLKSAYARVLDGEVYLVNASISTDQKEHNNTRSRKLLLHKREIDSLVGKMKQGKLTLVPTMMYNKGRLVKVELALAKGKRQFDKRQAIKARDLKIDLEREIKG